MNDFLGSPNASKLEDVPPVESSQTQGVHSVVTALDFLNLVLDDVVSLAPIGHDLPLEDTPDNVDVLVVEAETVGGSGVAESGFELKGSSLEVVLEYFWGFVGGLGNPSADEV